jgi:hypothetical protein
MVDKGVEDIGQMAVVICDIPVCKAWAVTSHELNTNTD